MNKLKSKVVSIWVQIRDLYLYFFRHAIVVNGYVDDHTWRGIRHRNWGDDLNYYFLRELTGKPIIFYHSFKLAQWLHLKNYLCIGTLLDGQKYKDNNTIVWGSGCSGAKRGMNHPQIVLAVRGPKSKEYLMQQGIYCPDVFGDPALLLPLVYNPRERFKVPSEREKCNAPLEREKEGNELTRAKHNYTHDCAVSPLTHKYALGIIPHVVDQQHQVIREIKEKYADEILVIDLARYERWTDVIDQICSCEKILSSSLHGLIVSDAYQIPNCWIELTGNISGGYFKYRDYGASVNRCFDEPQRVSSVADIDAISCNVTLAAKESVKRIQKDLLSVAPFKSIKIKCEK